LEAPLVAVDASAAIMNQGVITGDGRACDRITMGLCRRLPSIRAGMDQYGNQPHAETVWLRKGKARRLVIQVERNWPLTDSANLTY
jgi:hypothetical protein